MIDLSTAEKALKTFYLGVLAEQLNTKVNPLLAKIEQTSNDVVGNKVVKTVTYGLNGGVGAGTETGTLPNTGENLYNQMTLDLKNFYGKIELSDKALRAGTSNAGAVVNLLNAEMDGLIKASRYNFGRMLFGDGSGALATVLADEDQTDASIVKLDTIANVNVGMIVDFYNSNGVISSSGKARRIIDIDRNNNTIKINNASGVVYSEGSKVYVQNSKDNELTGLGAIFGNSDTIYGLTRADYAFLNPYINTTVGTLAISNIQDAIDNVEIATGGSINYIVSDHATRKKYVALCTANATNMDIMNLDGGYKAISYSGIPFVADRFCTADSIYLLNTDDFKLHQLCDWRWLENCGGSILKQSDAAPTYMATLVKYADLLCERPFGQALLTGITA